MKKIALIMLSLLVALPFYVSPAFAASFTAQEVSTHNTASNCWAIASNNVYNLTSIVTAHPGGQAAIINLCGKDATTAFNTVHGNSATAKAALASVLIGTLATENTMTPTVPTNLVASAISSSQVNLSWTASTDNIAVTGYNIYLGGNLIGTSSSPVFNNTGLMASTSYSYMVSAFNAAGNISVKSTPVSATTLAMSSDTSAPTMPSNLVASVDSDNQVALSWTASTDKIGVTGYKIMRDGEFLAHSDVASFIDTTVDPDTTYSYSVLAFNTTGNDSVVSSSVSIDTPSDINNDSENGNDPNYNQNDNKDTYCNGNDNNDWQSNQDSNQQSNHWEADNSNNND